MKSRLSFPLGFKKYMKFQKKKKPSMVGVRVGLKQTSWTFLKR